MMATYGYGLGGGSGGDTTIIVSGIVNANLTSSIQANIATDPPSGSVGQDLAADIDAVTLTANAQNLTGDIKCLIA